MSDELVSDSDRAALVADLGDILGFEPAVRAAVHGENAEEVRMDDKASTANVPVLRRPARRPGWLGEYQPWPCGRCGREVDDSAQHYCQPGEMVRPQAGQEEQR